VESVFQSFFHSESSKVAASKSYWESTPHRREEISAPQKKKKITSAPARTKVHKAPTNGARSEEEPKMADQWKQQDSRKGTSRTKKRETYSGTWQAASGASFLAGRAVFSKGKKARRPHRRPVPKNMTTPPGRPTATSEKKSSHPGADSTAEKPFREFTRQAYSRENRKQGRPAVF